MKNILLTSKFLITLIKAIKKNKIAVQNGWDGYRIMFLGAAADFLLSSGNMSMDC